MHPRSIRFFLIVPVVTAWPSLLASCTSDDSCECIAGHGSGAMDGAAVKRLQDEGLLACFTLRTGDESPDEFRAKAEELQEEAACLPHVVGKDARNGLDIEVFYHCSDFCPDGGAVGIRYRDVEEASCCGVGGEPRHDPAWGGYLGCVPPEATTETTCPLP